MRAVDLDDGLDDSLLHLLHAVELFIQNPSRLDRINGTEGRILPLDVQHDGQGALRVASLIRSDLGGAGNRQIPARPLQDMRRERSSRHIQEIRDTLKARQLHLVAFDLVGVLIRLLGRSLRRKESCNRVLKEPVLRGELCFSAGIHLADLVDAVAAVRDFTRQADIDAVVPEPADQILKPLIDLPDVGLRRRSVCHEMESCPLLRNLKASARVVPKPFCTVQNQQRVLRIRRLRILPEGRVSADLLLERRCLLRFLILSRCAEIKYLVRHADILSDSSYSD